MNFCLSDTLLARQRSRQWAPLITQQLRLRHVYQIFGFNFPQLSKNQSYYFTLHLTTLSAPFYTSDKIDNNNPKWSELDQRSLPNFAATAIVLRVWRHCPNADQDRIITTWGINFSGLIYLGNKIAEIQSNFFQQNTVILSMRYGYFTCYDVINWNCNRQLPFIDNLDLIQEINNEKIQRKTSIVVLQNEIRNSYDINKLRRLHSLQISMKNKILDVDIIREKIERKLGSNDDDYDRNDDDDDFLQATASSQANVRYAPQLLTMNSLNRMLETKPTRLQRKEMLKIKNLIEIAQFRTKLLSQEKDKKTASIRRYKRELKDLIDLNEEKSSNEMENYYHLNKDIERLQELKKQIGRNLETLQTLHTQLFQRRKQLLQQLLFIYPIQKHTDTKYTIHGIYLPNADILSDCSDQGISVALGYITHVLTMSSIFLQLPLRYPMIHHGSRSYVSDFISPIDSEREKEFPLFTKGKDKIQFTYAVYLLNKNIAQLRWYLFMHTPELKATLPNLLHFLQCTDAKDIHPMIVTNLNVKLDKNIPTEQLENDIQLKHNLDVQKYNNILKSITTTAASTKTTTTTTSRDCGPGLSEILAIPEAYLNKQITRESFKNFSVTQHITNNCNKIKERIGQEEELSDSNCDINDLPPIEQGTDMLDPALNLSDLSLDDGKSTTTIATATSNSNIVVGSSGDYNNEKQQQQELTKQNDVVVEKQLTARTDALLTTKSFNLVKSKNSL